MELKDYWHILRRRWRMVTLTVLAAVAVALAVTVQATPQYSSSAYLFVSTSDSDAGQAFQGGQFATQRVTSYADLIPKSRRLAEQVADALGDGSDPVTVQRRVAATVTPDTVNLQVTATDADPVRARDIAQAYAEALSTLVSQLETPDGSTNAIIKAEVVDNAQVSTAPVSPQPVRNLGLGLVLGLLLGVGLAVARELLDTSVTRVEQVAAITPAPILGHIGVDPGAVEQSPAESLNSTTNWAESFRVLRTNMQYVEVDSDQKVVVVTSSLPSEGKSTTAVNLAITLALANQRVALVECDLRRPLIAKRLGLDGAVGTTSVLIGKVSVDDAMQAYADTGLQVLACGPIPPNPSELLQSQAMEALTDKLRADFDVVILDAPPLLPVTDAALLAAQADGAMVIVRHGKTTQDQLTHAIDRLDAVDAKTLGVVMNMVSARGGGKGYGYGYGYGYGGYAYAQDPADEAPAKGRKLGRRRASA